MLKPQAVKRVVQIFQQQPQAVRAHYRMEVIDSQGKPTGEIKPPWRIPLPQGDLRLQANLFPFDLTWLPTSGNAFRRRVLERIFPNFAHLKVETAKHTGSTVVASDVH